jgi:hypothetical protein
MNGGHYAKSCSALGHSVESQRGLLELIADATPVGNSGYSRWSHALCTPSFNVDDKRDYAPLPIDVNRLNMASGWLGGSHMPVVLTWIEHRTVRWKRQLRPERTICPAASSAGRRARDLSAFLAVERTFGLSQQIDDAGAEGYIAVVCIVTRGHLCN